MKKGLFNMGKMESKYFSVVAAIIIAALVLSGPVAARNRLGFYIGTNISNMSLDDEDLTKSSRKGLVIGTFYDAQVAPNAAVQFRSGYVEKGASYAAIDMPFDMDMKLKYIETAVLLKVLMGSSSVQPYIVVGPSLAYLMDAKATMHINVSGYDDESRDLTEFFTESDLGFDMGLGFQSKYFFAEAIYNLGLSDIIADNSSGEVKTSGLKISGGVSIPLSW